MTQGLPAGPVGPADGAPQAPPDDTGEAIGLSSGGLTITFGVGPGLFRDGHGRDRFGLAGRRPEALADLPHFAGDQLDPSRSSTTFTSQATPRNLFGFKDGTANVKSEETDALAEHVWVAPDDDQAWLGGGSYLVARRIDMHIETWDRQGLQPQEDVVGRTKAAGAPLSGGTELTRPDLSVRGSNGPLIPADSHVAVVSPERNDGARIRGLRRPARRRPRGAHRPGALRLTPGPPGGVSEGVRSGERPRCSGRVECAQRRAGSSRSDPCHLLTSRTPLS